MKVCFPIVHNQGMDSLVSHDFDSSPMCMIVDTAARTLIEVANRATQERHGLCRELIRLGGGTDTAFVVDGIGAGALAELRQSGVKVFRAQPGTVADNLKRIARKELAELTGDPVVTGTGQFQAEDDDDRPGFGCGF